jgi:hypothetical protein
MPSTVRTAKLLIRPKANVQALMTGLARISGIHLNDRNTLSDSLVLKEMTELVKSPTIRATALSLIASGTVGSFSDSGQVLNGYNTTALRTLASLMISALMQWLSQV